MLEEVCRVIREWRTSKHLSCERDASNFRATEFETAETVEIRCSDREFLFEIIGVDDHGEVLFCADGAGFGLESREGFLGFVEAAVADEVPGGFGHEEEGWEEDGGPEPLQGEGGAVGPFVVDFYEAVKDTGCDELAYDEAHVCVTRQVDSQREW